MVSLLVRAKVGWWMSAEEADWEVESQCAKEAEEEEEQVLE